MEELLKTALEIRRSGNLKESNILLNELVSEYPDHALLHYECAWSHDIMSQEEEAIHFYEQALELGLSGLEAVNAYARIGLMYRLRGRLADSEKILMTGISKYWDAEGNGLLKALYAFTMYDMKKTGDAIRWMTEALLASSVDQGIMNNRKMLQYLGSNMDVPNIMAKLDAYPDTENKDSDEQKSIVEKVEDVLKVFEPTYFHGGWVFEFDHYEKHFMDSDAETRRAAVAAFAIMVGVWETWSAYSFIPQHERKYTGDFNPDRYHFELNNYIHAFYSNFNAIKQEFPVMTAYAVDALAIIDSREKGGLEQKFPEMDPVLFREFREEILMPYRQSKRDLPIFEDFLEEIGWDSSYSGW